MSQLGIGRPGPRYVERGGDIAFRQPFVAKDCRIHYFIVEADRDYLQAFLDRSFAEPSDGEIELRTIGPYVVVNFITVQRLGSGPPDDVLGVIPEKEASIWVPALRRRPGFDQLVWTVPYMFVDSGPAVTGGREIYGYPKQFADVAIEEDDDGLPQELSVTTTAIARHAPESVFAPQRVLEVKRRGRRPTRLHATRAQLSRARDTVDALRPEPDVFMEIVHRSVTDDAPAAPLASGDAITGLGRRVDLAEVAIRLWSAVLDGRVTMLLLKQFRAADNPEIACYQAIVEVDHTLSEVTECDILSTGYDVVFGDFDSQHMQLELGVPPAGHPRRPGMAFSVDFEFQVEPGRVLWEATAL